MHTSVKGPFDFSGDARSRPWKNCSLDKPTVSTFRTSESATLFFRQRAARHISLPPTIVPHAVCRLLSAGSSHPDPSNCSRPATVRIEAAHKRRSSRDQDKVRYLDTRGPSMARRSTRPWERRHLLSTDWVKTSTLARFLGN